MMNKLKIFVAAPISSFCNEEQYTLYRKGVLELILELRKNNDVYSEIENFSNLTLYDDPGKSAMNDFDKISQSDVFVLFHPKRMQTSAFIELGYALAYKKNIIIISERKNLPFLTLGLCDIIENVKLIQTSIIDLSIINKVVSVVKEFS